MTDKESAFIHEYLVDLNATQAAIRAGYSPKTAKQTASRLLSKANVAAALATRKAKQLTRADLSASRVLEELRRLAFSDIRGLFDATGNLKPLHTLNEDEAAAIASMEVVVKNAQAGDGHMDTIHKIKVWDKTRALEMLAKHFALLVERVQIEDEDGRIARLLAGRQRVATLRKA